MTSKPALLMSFAYDGGAWNAKQFGEPPHLLSGRLESVSSRLPNAMSALRSGPTTGAIERRPAAGGVPYFEASTVSPTHAIVTLFLLRPGVAAGVVAVVAGVVAVVVGVPVLFGSIAVSVMSTGLPARCVPPLPEASVAAAQMPMPATATSSAAPVARRRRSCRRRSSERRARRSSSGPVLTPRAGRRPPARPARGLHARTARAWLPSASAKSSPARTGASCDQASTPGIVATRAPAAAAVATSAGAARRADGASDGVSQGCARSHAAAARSTRSSSKRRPTICSPSGRPPVPGAIGTLIAGWPVRLNG